MEIFPNTPCVYFFGEIRRQYTTKDNKCNLLYIGQTVSPLSRFGNHISGHSYDSIMSRLAYHHQHKFIHYDFSKVDENYTVLTFDHKPVGRGKIIHGDGAIYQAVSFKALLFNMENNEVVDGYVSDVSEYGAFVRIGPVEALLHKSQILDEPIQVNMGIRRIEGAQSGKHIEEGSHVRSRVVSKAINQNDPRASKIGLNCKMAGLGAAGWITEND